MTLLCRLLWLRLFQTFCNILRSCHIFIKRLHCFKYAFSFFFFLSLTLFGMGSGQKISASTSTFHSFLTRNDSNVKLGDF